MKRLTTLLTMAITFTGLAQQMPYNPDANGDDFVGVDDVLGVLGVYDTALMQPDLQCDYEGTELEEFTGGHFAGDLILDSVYVEYLFVDSVETFLPGCPQPVYIETVLERSYMLMDQTFDVFEDWTRIEVTSNYLGHHRSFWMGFYEDGTYIFTINDLEMGDLTNYGNRTFWYSVDGCEPGSSGTCNNRIPIPFPEDWTIDENGFQVVWSATGWAGNCESLRIIPFWHEAE